MNANHIRVLMGCAGCIIGATAFGAAPVDGPSQAVLASYSFQPQVFGDPAPAVVSPSGSVALIPLIAIAPAAQPEKKPAYHDFRSLEEALAQEKKQREEALFSWITPRDTKVELIAKPDVQAINIFWTPMIATEETPFTPAGATRKLEVLFPLAKVMW